MASEDSVEKHLLAAFAAFRMFIVYAISMSMASHFGASFEPGFE